MLAILILAAGQSSRMCGADKLLEQVEDAPLLTTITRRACATGHPIWVAMPPDAPKRVEAIDGLAITPVTVHDADKGMAHSIVAGLLALPATCSALMILPADMPMLQTTDLIAMATKWASLPPDSLLQANSQDGMPGHPVIFPNSCFDALRALAGDVGARSVVQSHKAQLHHLTLPSDHATLDLDTPEEWAKWRNSSN